MNKRINVTMLVALVALLLLAAWASGTAGASRAAVLPAAQRAPALPHVQQFEDVPDNNPDAVCINCVAAAGLMSGYACGGAGEPCVPPANRPYFRPTTAFPPTRAGVAQVIALGAGYSDPISPTQQTYADVPPANPAWLAVERVTLHGVMGGYSCGGPGEPCDPQNRPYFRPANILTRGQFAKTIAQAAGFNETPGGQTFADVPPSNPFYLYAERVALHGVMDGYPCGGSGEPCPGTYFRPNTNLNLTRAQMAQALARAFLPGCAPYSSPTPTATGTPPTATPTTTGTPPTSMPTNTPVRTAVLPTNTVPTASATPTAGGIRPTATATPAGTLGSISGIIYANSISPTNALSGAYVYISVAAGTLPIGGRIITGADGRYAFANLAPRQYYVYAFTPGGSVVMTNYIGPLTLPPGGNLTNQHIVMPNPLPLPPDMTITPREYRTSSGVPVIFLRTAFTIRKPACPGGTATYQIRQFGVLLRGPLPMTEGPAGIYTANVAALSPIHGPIEVEIDIVCPDGTHYTITFNMYIDPSGYVRTTDGDPIPGATVSLYRADDPAGPFTFVPNASGLMSPANRQNPDLTGADGQFGWDVIPGYYQVRASHAACYAPGNPGQPYVDSAVLTIPPAVLDLDLRLECPGTIFTDVPASQPFYRYVHWLGTWGYVGGYACGGPGEPCDAQQDAYFRPASRATRGQFAKMLGNALLWSEAISPTQQTFADVPPTQPFWLFAERVAAHGASSGYACGGPAEPCDAQRRPYFRPANNITRSQLAKILAEARPLVAVIPAGQQTFADVPTSNAFWVYVERAARQGILSGYSCGGAGEPCDAAHHPYFRPYSPATRGQISKMIDLALAQP